MAVTVTIAGGPAVTTVREMSLSSAQNQRDRLTATLISADGTNIRPDIDDEVLVVEDTVTIFGGSIKTPELAGYGSSPVALTIRLSALDYNELGDRIMLVSVAIPTGTLKAAATALLPYLPGVTIDATWTLNPTADLPALTYDGVYADAALEDLSQRTGWVRHINHLKKLKYWEPGTVAAPWNVTDGDGNVVGDLSSAITRKDYANRIIVKYMDAATSAWGFFGPDIGSTANPSPAETVTIGTKTYTFRAAINNATPNEVLIGATSQATLINTACAISGLGGSGTTYSSSTVTSTEVVAWEGRQDLMSIRAITPGAAGNSLATTETCAAWRCFHEGNVVYGTLWGGIDEAARNTAQCDDIAQQALYGVYTRVVEAPNVWTVTDAQALGTAILTEATTVAETIRYRTTRSGLVPGMTQTIASVLRHVVSASYLITSVETRWAAGELTWRDVTAVKGAVFKASAWRDQYKKWSGSLTSNVATAAWYGGGSPSVPTTRVTYAIGGSRALTVAPNPAAMVPIPEWVPIKAPAGFAATVRVWLWAKTAAIVCSARVVSGTDGITYGTLVATFATVTSQTPVERSVTFSTVAGLYYRVEIQPSVNGEGVGCVGYLESA